VRIALKVDVDTYRGTLEGVPRLVETLRSLDADATFLFSLGPDHTGRALTRIFRPGFLGKVLRTSVGSHYGWKTLCYGVLLPGPDIGRRAAAEMRAVRDAGFEVGIHSWDHVKWHDRVAGRGEAWTRAELAKAADRFREVFGEAPATHGAAGWQMNAHAFRWEEESGMAYASDTRGTGPFRVALAEATLGCVQLPTTLPTLDEIVGTGGVTEDNAAGRILALSSRDGGPGHVYTLHAELEGMKLLPVFRDILEGFRDRGDELVSMKALHAALDPESLPVHEVVEGTIPGRSGTLAVPGARIGE
jgi:undecaprenyl phosphate-alpha-L-ara4FN deformylase